VSHAQQNVLDFQNKFVLLKLTKSLKWQFGCSFQFFLSDLK